MYGDDRKYLELKNFVADYLKAELGFFKQFITDPHGPEHYISQVRKDGVWADNIEIQIMAELYDCRIELFTTSRVPIKVFNEKPEAIKIPLRLFYLQKCHYEVIWDPKRAHPLQGHVFGVLERAGVEAAEDRHLSSTGQPKLNRTLSNTSTNSISPSKECREFFEKNSKSGVNSEIASSRSFEEFTCYPRSGF